MTNEPTHFDIFSGIGGFSLAFESAGFRTVAFSEIDEGASAVLKYWWPDVPNLGPIEGIGAGFLQTFGRPNVITGGVPCQPASLLGTRRGTTDERWLWPEAIRVVGLLRPDFAVFENPPALLTLEGGGAFNGIGSALAEIGYDLLWDVLPAAIFGAGHLRERLVIIAANSDDIDGRQRCWQDDIDGRKSFESHTSNSHSSGRGARRARRSAGDSSEQTEQALRVDVAHSDGERREETRESTSVRSKNADDLRIESSERSSQETRDAADGGSTRLQGHARNGENGEGRTKARRPIAPPDLRGRVNRADWWHEHVTGVSVLVHGLPSKLVEAACRCSGNAIVPQVFQPIAKAIKRIIQ